MPFFRSHHQARLLSELLLHPEVELTLTALARRIGTTASTLHLDARRLVDVGVLSERADGRNRLLRANTESRLFHPLADLLLVTYGPADVIADEFGAIAGAAAAYIFGSWAARYVGEPGPTPNDIDVVVVGDSVSRLAIDAAAQRAESRLHVPVQTVVLSPDRWATPSDPLTAQIRASPLVSLFDGDVAAAEPAK